MRCSHLTIAVLIWAACATLPGTAQASDWPRFRPGMWQFERTLELGGRHADLPKDQRLLYRREMTRCVDPTESMRMTFKPAMVGSCRSVAPEISQNQYVFALRCDYMGPVRTVIEVESDSAYTEMNELTVGDFPRVEMITARRLGECNGASPTDTGTPAVRVSRGLMSTR